MILKTAELFQLKIPFKIGFSHAKAERFYSDSIILKVAARSGSDNITGYGEAVIRDYVSGRTDSVIKAFTDILEPFREQKLLKEEVIVLLKNLNPPVEQLPILCAVETALLQILCAEEKIDIYELLNKKPLRNEIIYGGTLPLLPLKAAESLLNGYKKMGITNLRVKIGKDPGQIDKTLQLVRRIMGDDFDIKTDANAGWSVQDAVEILPLLKNFGISIIEEPFGREAVSDESSISLLKKTIDCSGITFMADESALNTDDITAAAINKTYGMVNIRLAKNGGILKALAMAEEAERKGIRYMCGCHVGETGILSAAGRTAASLMINPEYTDGSYDSHLLSGNITNEDLTFAYGGKADIIRGRGCGFSIEDQKLRGYSIETTKCF